MSLSVTLYNKPSCPQCTASERKLKEKGVDFEHKPALDDDNLEFIKSLGHLQAPVLIVEEDGEIIEHWSGYRPDLIEKYAA